MSPELDGPFSIPITFVTATDVSGATFQNAVAFDNNRWNCTLTFFTRNTAALSAYRVIPINMYRIWAGDDPLNPTMTVALAFPDSDTANTVLSNLI